MKSMVNTDESEKILDHFQEFITTPNVFRSVIVLFLALVLAYWLSRFVAKGIIKVAQIIAVRSDNESDDTRAMRLRQTETYLSIATAIARVVVVVLIGYLAWLMVNPLKSNSAVNSIAAIGAGTFLR